MTKENNDKLKFNVTSNQKKEKTIEEVKDEAISKIDELLGDDQFIDGEQDQGYRIDFSEMEAVSADQIKTYTTESTKRFVMIEGVVFKDTIDPELIAVGYKKQLPSDFKYTLSNLSILDEDGSRIAHKFNISTINFILNIKLKEGESVEGPILINLLGNLDADPLKLKVKSNGVDVTDQLNLIEHENNLIVSPKSPDFVIQDVSVEYDDVEFHDIGQQEVMLESELIETENSETVISIPDQIKEEIISDPIVEIEEPEEVERVQEEIVTDPIEEKNETEIAKEDTKTGSVIKEDIPVKKSGKAKVFTFAAIILAAVGGYYVGTGAFGVSTSGSGSGDVVKVGNKVYTNEDVVKSVGDVPETLNRFEGSIINKEIIAKYGDEEGKKKAQATFDEEKKRLGKDLLPSLQRVGVGSEEEYLEGLIYQEAMAKYIDTKISDKDIEDYYNNWLPNQKVKVQFTQTKEDAEKVVKEIQESEGSDQSEKINSYSEKNPEVYLDYEMSYGMRQVTDEDFKELSKLKEFESGIYKMPENVGDNEYVVVTMIDPKEKGSFKESKEEVKAVMIQAKFQDPEALKKVIYKDLKIEPISDFGKAAFDPTRN